ncbi:hypothetical protein PV379_11030 [Streptomyces caniscabiei]|uniref:hypothetical protein n=1 Tax=Streptomyces caniscabiei TaxID=2746961 RepID=UPI0029B9A441|nr:hypothetical protein [Streptomyces caniscabiei]MDX2601676.1 hypothetical protein [Streptomyces caniscabiei]MDX2737111.1 hypothetical protein [Streptomyces caniscabiei]MDX2777842.1 hypothetical protein [Streptomyces caniscabiei]
MRHQAATDHGPSMPPDPESSDSKARNQRLRLLAIGVVAGAALAVGGILAFTWITGGNTRTQTDAKPSPSSEVDKSSAPQGRGQEYTPATARAVSLLKPSSNANGIGTGFEHSSLGADSAAVSYWQDFDLRDEVIARKQWTAVTSEDSSETIDRGVSGTVGLPPDGGAPNGGSAVVKAILTRSLDDSGDVVVVWMAYDRLAADGDAKTLEDETTYLILKWEDGDWKVTEEPQYKAKVRGPRSYHPDSKWAFMDGWRRVSLG